MIEHADEEHDVESFTQFSDVIDRELLKLDIQPLNVSGKPRLRQIILIEIHAQHARRTAPLHLHGIEPGVAADVQHRLTRQVGGQAVLEPPPFHGRVITQEMLRRGLHPAQIHVVEPGSQRLRPRLDRIRRPAQATPS